MDSGKIVREMQMEVRNRRKLESAGRQDVWMGKKWAASGLGHRRRSAGREATPHG